MNILRYILIAAAAYLIGSFSFSITLSRLVFHKDVREGGSGNAGATNMARTYGIWPGLVTLLGDVAKAAVSCTLGYMFLEEPGLALAGAACITGHCFPVYYGFKGGKGVSAGLAIAFATEWRCGIAAIAVFLLTAFLSKKVSLGSMLGCVSAVVCSFVVSASLPRTLMLCYTAFFIIIRHSENISRLIAGTEKDFRVGGK